MKRPSRRKKHAPCVYCGKSGGHADHVPPKAFFPEPRPSNLVTVPSCQSCNGGAAREQDFFVATLMLSDVGETPVGAALWKQGLMKMYTRPRGLGREIQKRMSERDEVTPSGLYAGRRLAIEIDYARLERFVRHVVRGLYWHEYKASLSPSATVEVAWINSPRTAELFGPQIAILGHAPSKWPGVFEYRRECIAESPQHSAWAILFFGKVLYYAYTEPPN